MKVSSAPLFAQALASGPSGEVAALHGCYSLVTGHCRLTHKLCLSSSIYSSQERNQLIQV